MSASCGKEWKNQKHVDCKPSSFFSCPRPPAAPHCGRLSPVPSGRRWHVCSASGPAPRSTPGPAPRSASGSAPRSAPSPAPRSSRLCARLRGAELRALHTPVPLCQPPPRRPQSGRRARAAIAPSAFCGRRHQLHLRWLRNQAQSPQPSGTVSQPREASSEHRVPSAAWCRWLGGLGPTAGCGPPLRAPGFCRPHVCPLLLQPEGSQLPPLSPSSPCAFLALQ